MKQPFVLRYAFAIFAFFITGLSPVFAGSASDSLPPFVLVSGGSFWQGSKEGAWAANEAPRFIQVSDFYIAAHETTQALWSAVRGSNPSVFKGVDRPVENVSWLEVVRFCNQLSELEGLEPAYTISGSSVQWNREANGYRLPTEAEWEYAARGGPAAYSDTPLQKAPYAGGFNADAVAWYAPNSGKATHPVAKKVPNELGLYDMSGNVWEWCWDWYALYDADDTSNPSGSDASTGRRVMRGGAWFTPVNLIRSTYRYWNIPTFKVNSLGFRLVRNAEPELVPETAPEELSSAEKAIEAEASSISAETNQEASTSVPDRGTNPSEELFTVEVTPDLVLDIYDLLDTDPRGL